MGNADTLQISIVVELVTVAVTLLLTVITVFSLYRKALNDTKNRIDDSCWLIGFRSVYILILFKNQTIIYIHGNGLESTLLC